MNGAVNSAAAEQGRVRGVHNRIHIELGDIAAEDVDPSRVLRTGLSGSCLQFKARVDRFARSRPAAGYNEIGRANDWRGPARIRTDRA